MKAGPIGRSVQAEGEEGLPRYGAPDMKYENTTLLSQSLTCWPAGSAQILIQNHPGDIH